MTLQDLKTFAKRNARLDSSNYAGDASAYRQDYYQVSKARKQCEKFYRFIKAEEPLIDGEYYDTRLLIKNDKIEYIAGQYTPTEIYWAVLDYLHKTNEV
jgi:hypothetical protein